MSFTRPLHSGVTGRVVLLALLAALLATSAVVANTADAANEPPSAQGTQSPLQDEEDYDPEANLPYLFAVFIVAWAGFFGYIFFMSRRQREMQREIDALKMALAERDSSEGEG